jgi:hypothetical protein
MLKNAASTPSFVCLQGDELHRLPDAIRGSFAHRSASPQSISNNENFSHFPGVYAAAAASCSSPGDDEDILTFLTRSFFPSHFLPFVVFMVHGRAAAACGIGKRTRYFIQLQPYHLTFLQPFPESSSSSPAFALEIITIN